MNVPCDKFYSVEDVMSILGVGKSKAYQVMKKFNDELEAEGYFTVSGRVSRGYFDSRTMYEPGVRPPWRKGKDKEPEEGVRTCRTGKSARDVAATWTLGRSATVGTRRRPPRGLEPLRQRRSG